MSTFSELYGEGLTRELGSPVVVSLRVRLDGVTYGHELTLV